MAARPLIDNALANATTVRGRRTDVCFMFVSIQPSDQIRRPFHWCWNGEVDTDAREGTPMSPPVVRRRR
jgi:hypothetical protein